MPLFGCVRVVLAVVLLTGLVPARAVGQAVRAGVVTTLEGTATVTSVTVPQPRPLGFKDDVFVNDRVVTGDRSIVRMLLGGKAVVTVRERTALTITEVPDRSTISVESGKIALAVAREKMRPGEQLEVRTPNAVAGVRGTVFITEVTRATTALDAAPAVTTYFYGFSGLVHVTIGTQVFTLTPNSVFTRIGLHVPTLGAMTAELRARAQAGLQPKTPPVGQAGVNEQAMAASVNELSGTGGTAIGGQAPLPLVQPPSYPTAPILPGGVSRVTPPPPPPPATPPSSPNPPLNPGR
jgi:hypothetical protein